MSASDATGPGMPDFCACSCVRSLGVRNPWQLGDFIVKRQRRHIGVNLGGQIRIRMAEHFLGGPLIDPIADAEGLPGLPERMEVDDASEAVLSLDPGALQIAAQNVVGRPGEPKARAWSANAFGLGLAQFARPIRAVAAPPACPCPSSCPRGRGRRAGPRPGEDRPIRAPGPRTCAARCRAASGRPSRRFPAMAKQPPQLLLVKRPGRPHLLPAHVHRVQLSERVDQQPLRLHEPVEERARRNLIFLLRLRRAGQPGPPFHERVRAGRRPGCASRSPSSIRRSRVTVS